MIDQVFILDNGAYQLKTGFASTPPDVGPKCIPNCIAKVKSERRRPFIGDQLDDIKDFSGLWYILGFQKGFLINWETQKKIWDHVFTQTYQIDYPETSLIITEPYFNFRAIQENLTEIMFEEYGFKSLLRTNPGYLSSYRYCKNEAGTGCLVVDSGYSFTHICAYVDGRKVKESITRIDVGGKALTNYLKDIISYRQLNVLDETYVMNQMKEDACYVSLDVTNDLKNCSKKVSKRDNLILRDYVLPDFTNLRRGYLRDPNATDPIGDYQVVKMNNERFQVPEVLFNPSDVGINQVGISHGIVHSIDKVSKDSRSILSDNIVVTGGNACFSGFRDRVQQDVRSMIPYLYKVNTFSPDNPLTYAWTGGQLLAQNAELFRQVSVTKKDYEERGNSYCNEKFDV